MVELCDLLHGSLVRELDIGEYNGGNRPELVAEYSRNICQSADLLHCIFFNSRCASVYHIGYPGVARSVFGMWGSYYFVGARAALAIIWYGVQRKFLLYART